MRQMMVRNWNFMRLIRLGLGITIMLQAVFVSDWMMGIFGILFTSMPLFNLGCCATGACTVPEKKDTELTKNIANEEVD